VAEVNPKGEVVRTHGEMVFKLPHDPEMLPNSNLLVPTPGIGAIELDMKTGEIVWQYLILDPNNWPVRDANRLPNGNTLVTD